MIIDILTPDSSLVPVEEVLNKVGWPDPVRITALKKHKLTLIDLTQNPVDNDWVEWLDECLSEFHIKYILLSPNANDHLRNDHTFYYNSADADYTQKYLSDLVNCINTLG
jgi:hypothetical protein